MEKSIAVVGAGAVGLFYGALLQRAGHRVVFQTRSGAAGLAERELSIRSPWGDFSLPVEAVAATEEMAPADLVIVSVKALPVIDYAGLLAPVVRAGTAILLLQNGLNTDERVAAFFPQAVVLAGLAFTCINRKGPAEVLHADYGSINIGSLDSGGDEAARRLSGLMEEAGIPCSFGGPARSLRWKKLLWNVPFNCLSVVCGGVTTDLLMNDPGSRRLAETLMREVQAAAAADGFPLSDETVRQMLEDTRRMTPYRTSMMIDYELGRPMEVEAILGEPLKTATGLGVAVPAMRTLYDLLSFYNRKSR